MRQTWQAARAKAARSVVVKAHATARSVACVIGADHPRAVEIVTREILASTKTVKPATAAKLTREIKADDCAAVAFADHRSVTGALVKVTMRARPAGKHAPTSGRAFSLPRGQVDDVQKARALRPDLDALYVDWRASRGLARKRARSAYRAACLDLGVEPRR